MESIALVDVSAQEQKVVEEILEKTICNLSSSGEFDEENS